MEWAEIAPLIALGVGALGFAGIWHKLGRMESKVDLALRMMREHTHADGSPATASVPVEGNYRHIILPGFRACYK